MKVDGSRYGERYQRVKFRQGRLVRRGEKACPMCEGEQLQMG